MGIAEPQVARVRGKPPSVPEGLKATALKDPDLLEPASDYPVVKWGNYTYWPLSYVDNRYALCVVAYDGASSKVVKQWELKGARYVVSASVDKAVQSVILVGQSSLRVSISWDDMGRVAPSNPQFFWMCSNASLPHQQLLVASSQNPVSPGNAVVLATPSLSDADSQLWLFDDARQAIFPKAQPFDFCLDHTGEDRALVLSRTSWARTQQRWIFDPSTQQLTSVATPSLVAAASLQNNTIIVQKVLASKPASQLWRLKPFISSPDISTDQFPLLVPGEPFALSNLSQQLLTSSGSGRPLTCNKSNGRPSANQYWVYNGAGGLLNAHDQLAVTHSTAPPASSNSPVIASPWTGSPQQQWLLTSDGYFLCRANNKVLTSNASAGTVALVDYEPLGSTDQRWFLAKRRDKRSLPPASTKVTKLKVIARVSDDLFAGTSDVIYITFSPPGSGYLATLFDGPSRGDVATINIDIQRMFGKSEINLLEDIPTVLIYQAEKSAIFSDDWKLASITMMGSTNEGEDFTNYTFQKVDKWLGVNASQFHIGALKLVWSSSIPWGAWLDKNRKPIDLNSQTYPVGWMPYIGDLKSWRTYDPSQIDGVGYLIGMRHGKLIGELLKTRQTEILQPSSDKHSYTWVFTPSGAIIYKLWDKDVDLSEYVRHSQLGSGNPVICAGEMKIRKAEENNYVVTDMIAIINDASGHYKPDGGACLRYVGKKLQELGIPTDKTSWYSRKP